MNVPIGWFIAIAACALAFVEIGGKLSDLWQPYEFLIIIGASGGALLAGNKGRNLKNIAFAFGRVMIPASVNKKANTELLSLMFEILQRMKRDGALSIDGDVEKPESSALFGKYPRVVKNKRLMVFLRDYLRIVIDGSASANHIEAVFSQEIEMIHKEAIEPSNSLNVVADALPAFGIVAAITGVVYTLNSLTGDVAPSLVGAGIAKALVGTLLGVFLSYAVIGPVAMVLKQLADAEMRPYEAVKEIIIAYYAKYAPLVAVEYGRKALYSDQRPSMDELEQSVMAAFGQKMRDR
ncbi:MAG: flagellar motor stator protein MotA [Gammaproteobacteria bacterium]|nr:flagellar motor stator protein MotA [Gammaproteobacteria bacterium]